jgi:hypothetical protein
MARQKKKVKYKKNPSKVKVVQNSPKTLLERWTRIKELITLIEYDVYRSESGMYSPGLRARRALRLIAKYSEQMVIDIMNIYDALYPIKRANRKSTASCTSWTKDTTPMLERSRKKLLREIEKQRKIAEELKAYLNGALVRKQADDESDERKIDTSDA